jgi:hypothetical protein
MMRYRSGAAIAVIVFVSTSSSIAMAATPATNAPPSKFAEQCTALEAQWNSVLRAHEADKYFARASRESEKGHADCKSPKLATQKNGVGHFKNALKLINVKPEI